MRSWHVGGCVLHVPLYLTLTPKIEGLISKKSHEVFKFKQWRQYKHNKKIDRT